MAECESHWTRSYIRDDSGHRLYELPKTEDDWYLWEADITDRGSEKLTILFQDTIGYWSLHWKGYLHIHALVKFFIDKTIDEKELLNKYKIQIKRSLGPEPDKGPWFSTTPSPGKLWMNH